MITTASGIITALKHDLIRDEFRPAGLLLPEVQAPNSDRRADAIWMTARTANLTGYEIKVTRADLLTELRDPTKCEPWLKYCDYWWLVVAEASIVEGLEDHIPEDWGICTPPTKASRRMFTVIRKAPKLAPADKGPVLGKLISQQAYQIIESQKRVRDAEYISNSIQSRQTQIAAQAQEQARRDVNPYHAKFAAVAEAYAKICTTNNLDTALNVVDPDIIANAIHDSHNAEQLAKAVETAAVGYLDNLDRVVADVKESFHFRQLQQLLKEAP